MRRLSVPRHGNALQKFGTEPFKPLRPSSREADRERAGGAEAAQSRRVLRAPGRIHLRLPPLDPGLAQGGAEGHYTFDLANAHVCIMAERHNSEFLREFAANRREHLQATHGERWIAKQLFLHHPLIPQPPKKKAR